jgi:hypothetical protein
MVYGQKPLPLEEDTALKQPCYASLCKFSEGTYSHPDANPLNQNEISALKMICIYFL